MKQTQYERLLVLVKVSNDDIETLSDEAYDFIQLPKNEIIINYHEFDVAVEDYDFKSFKIIWIMDPKTKEFFNKEDL